MTSAHKYTADNLCQGGTFLSTFLIALFVVDDNAECFSEKCARGVYLRPVYFSSISACHKSTISACRKHFGLSS